jgi:flavodoxin short chain
MKNIAIVYWSGTGHTAAMADAIAHGAKEAGAEVTLFKPKEFSADRLKDFDVAAFGCPATGAEVLEKDEFDPMFAQLENSLAGKKIALFGSYGWGGGKWMRAWAARCAEADLYNEGLIVNKAPTQEDIDACLDLGRKLAAW